MKEQYLVWYATVQESVAGKDYPEGKLLPSPVARRFWTDEPLFSQYLEAWKKRPEYKSWLETQVKKQK